MKQWHRIRYHCFLAGRSAQNLHWREFCELYMAKKRALRLFFADRITIIKALTAKFQKKHDLDRMFI
jgi:hypothetical protein